MKNQKTKIELLAPAGSPEKMKYAFQYGADAVYAGIPDFSMRSRINKFDPTSLEDGIKYAHQLGKKFYVTVNIYAHNTHLSKIEKHLKFLAKIKPDAIIASDPGVIALIQKHAPKIDIHVSTQANTTNIEAVGFWKKIGARRVILAREVSLEETKQMHKKFPKMELEIFVHGAMCMSYSGRCILSKWMSGRSANLGDCSQPCRWAYKKTEKVNEQTKIMQVQDHLDEFEVDLEEDYKGTYFFNSRDMNMLAHLADIKKSGVCSFKIEGRNKSVYYLATVVRAYRKVLDAIESKASEKELKKIIREQQKELDKLVHRGYWTGFLLGDEPPHGFDRTHLESDWEFVGEVFGSSGNKIEIMPHNAVRLGDKLEIMSRDKNFSVKIKNIWNNKNELVESAHGGQNKTYTLEVNKKEIEPMSLLRKKLTK